MFARLRLLGPWGWLTLILIYAFVGSIAAAPFHKNSLVAAIVANVAGIIAAVLYLMYWRRHFAKPS